MRTYRGHVRQVQLDHWGQAGVWIACPPAAIPVPGQYLIGRAIQDEDEVLGTPLFTAGTESDGFLAAPPLPATWEPGTHLELRGPTGRGLHLPPSTQRLALIALGKTPARLLPFAAQALGRSETTVALYTDASLPWLPAALEVQPLQSVPEVLAWTDFLAIDIPLESLADLRLALGLGEGERLPCPGEVLIETLMPCGGLADCGACAVPGRRGWRMACKEGPVFDINEIQW
jgi:Iron-sulfur cluster binding domain of dihydroorotate dehydrogenase B